MTTRLPRIILAALCCTLFLATSASAECAWVMWATINGGLYNNVVAPVSALDTKEACERALGDQIAKQVATAKKSGIKVTASETLVIVQTRHKNGSLASLGT